LQNHLLESRFGKKGFLRMFFRAKNFLLQINFLENCWQQKFFKNIFWSKTCIVAKIISSKAALQEKNVLGNFFV